MSGMGVKKTLVFFKYFVGFVFPMLFDVCENFYVLILVEFKICVYLLDAPIIHITAFA